MILVFFSGVVFNEMKGVYSQPDNILGRTAQQASLFFVVYLHVPFHFLPVLNKVCILNHIYCVGSLGNLCK